MWQPSEDSLPLLYVCMCACVYTCICTSMTAAAAANTLYYLGKTRVAETGQRVRIAPSTCTFFVSDDFFFFHRTVAFSLSTLCTRDRRKKKREKQTKQLWDVTHCILSLLHTWILLSHATRTFTIQSNSHIILSWIMNSSYCSILSNRTSTFVISSARSHSVSFHLTWQLVHQDQSHDWQKLIV